MKLGSIHHDGCGGPPIHQPMFESFLKKPAHRLLHAHEPALRLDRERLWLLDEHFPIGRKLRYFPEHHRDILFTTIVLGYRVNDHLLYSREAVTVDAAGKPQGFSVTGTTAFLPLAEVRRFELIVPDTSELERSLDYVRRASIGPAGQFHRGNTITLLGQPVRRGVPMLETRVERRTILKDGPYAHETLIFLAPDLDTLSVTDLRQKERIEADLPTDLYLAEDLPPLRCRLVDFSDVALRLRPPEGGTLPPMAAGDRIVVVLRFAEHALDYRFKGTVLRADAMHAVVRLTQLYKDDAFVRLSLLDLLEIKAALLNRRPAA